MSDNTAGPWIVWRAVFDWPIFVLHACVRACYITSLIYHRTVSVANVNQWHNTYDECGWRLTIHVEGGLRHHINDVLSALRNNFAVTTTQLDVLGLLELFRRAHNPFRLACKIFNLRSHTVCRIHLFDSKLPCMRRNKIPANIDSDLFIWTN